MSSWIVVPCLVALRDEYNRVSPNRDKGADGTIGDTSHTSSSDHSADEDSLPLKAKDSDTINEVHALDIDSSGPWPEAGWFNASIMTIVANHKAGRDDRLHYVIWNRKIAGESSNWEWQNYTATDDPHLNHAHFSARYGSGSGSSNPENDTSSWGVDMTIDTTDADVLINRMAERMMNQAALATPTDNFVKAMRAVVWQYQGGGLPTGASSTLGAMALVGNTATALKAAVAAVMANVQADDDDKAQLLADAQAHFDALDAKVNAVPDAVFSKLADATTPDEETANVLRELLGDRTAAIKALL